MKIIILSNGPGLKEIVTLYGHSSEWIPNSITDKNISFKVIKTYETSNFNIENADGFIITGSKYSVYDSESWIKDLKNNIDDILNLDESSIHNDKLIVFGNLPYNISTEILCKWILNLSQKKIWFDYLILMFQKEVADRIISSHDKSDYGRLSIISNWRLNIKKICDISPGCFYPRPKVYSSLLLFSHKKKIISIKNPNNLEKITRTFFKFRRKMIKKSYKQLFKDNKDIIEKLKINLNSRPQDLDLNTYYKLTKEYEKLLY